MCWCYFVYVVADLVSMGRKVVVGVLVMCCVCGLACIVWVCVR